MVGILPSKELSLKVQTGIVMEIATIVVVVVTVIVTVVTMAKVVILVEVVVVGVVIASNVASLAISQGNALLVMVVGMTGTVAGMTGTVAGMTGMVAMAAAAMGLIAVAIVILVAVMEEAAMVVVVIDTAVKGLDLMSAPAEVDTDSDVGVTVSGIWPLCSYRSAWLSDNILVFDYGRVLASAVLLAIMCFWSLLDDYKILEHLDSFIEVDLLCIEVRFVELWPSLSCENCHVRGAMHYIVIFISWVDGMDCLVSFV